MQEIFKHNDLKIIKFNEQDYSDKSEEITNIYGMIFASYEAGNDNFDQEKAHDNLKSTLDKFFTDGNANLYILFKGNIPVSASSFSIDFDYAYLELITTSKNYRSMGYAKLLTLEAFKNLKEQDINNITLVVNKDNYKSNNLQESISNIEGIRTFVTKTDNRIGYTYDISNLESYEVDSQLF